jgi:SNF2 family DNA or RNA helicase
VTAVYGELDEAGAFIRVTCGGGDRDRDQCAAVLRNLTPNFNPAADRDVMQVPLSWAAVTQLAHGFTGASRWDGSPGLQWVPGPRLSDWLIAEIIRRSCEGDYTGEPPVLEPMKHQRGGAVAAGMNGRFLLADDMGTGKTLTYLMSLAELDARNRNPWPALLVTPAGVVDTILEEVPRFYPGWQAVAYRGSGRHKYLRSNARLLVMGYETMRNDVGEVKKPGPLLKLRARAVVYDEVHSLCNYDSLQSRMARRLAAHVPNVIAGSGTPITKNVAGFWPVLNSMYPASYPDRGRYKGHYCLSRGKPQYGSGDAEITGIDPVREPEFRVAMQGVFRRVAKEDVLDLPPKTYSTRYVEIPAAWRAAYDQMEEDMLAELPDSMTPLEANVAIVKMTRLRQLACSACDVTVTREAEQNPRSPNFGQEVEHAKVTLKEPCWKGAELVEILRELHEAEGEFDERGGQHGHVTGSRPAIAFAESAQLIRVAGAMAEKKGYAVGYIDGDVPLAERTEVRLAFQANELDLVCVTTGTGGTGLNLTAADTVVFLARPWGYVPAVQAEDRAYRRGQDKPVQVIDIVAKKSVESRVLARLREKAGNLADLVRDRRIVESFLGGRARDGVR